MSLERGTTTILLLGLLICVGRGAFANTPPVAGFLDTAPSDGSALTVLLDASESHDPDGSIVAYQWVFGDGYTGSGAAKSHTYPSTGDYEVTLVVRDDDGATHMITRTITLHSPKTSGSRTTGGPISISGAGGLPTRVGIGCAAPAFNLTDLVGNEVHLSHFLGKVVILVFWRSNCPACHAAMPQLRSLRQRYRNHGLIVVGVNLDQRPEIASNFVRENGYSDFVTLWEASTRLRETIRTYGVTGLPHIFVIDRQGILRTSHAFPRLGAEDIEPWL